MEPIWSDVAIETHANPIPKSGDSSGYTTESTFQPEIHLRITIARMPLGWRGC